MAGFAIHLFTASCIGIVAGVFLYKTNILNISKPSNGLRYGLLVGIIVCLVFAIPVEQFVLDREYRNVVPSQEQPATSNASGNINNENTNNALPTQQSEYGTYHANINRNSNLSFSSIQVRSFITLIMIHLLYGITLGLSSFLSIKFGARYLCPRHCEVSFSRIDTLQSH